jgi:response regulator RpfG family c-di-GMP phosphodiesterase
MMPWSGIEILQDDISKNNADGVNVDSSYLGKPLCSHYQEKCSAICLSNVMCQLSDNMSNSVAIKAGIADFITIPFNEELLRFKFKVLFGIREHWMESDVNQSEEISSH